jgi:pyruvate formate lyase activating enzyme
LKGLIFDIRRFSTKDGPGIRTTVFFKGCSLNCIWCHNPEGRSCESQKAIRINKIGELEFPVEETIGKEMSVDEVMNEVIRDLITFSGGEPFEQEEFLIALMTESKRNNLHTALDTTGYTSENTLQKVIEYTDLFLYDLKIMDNDEHLKYTGVSNKSILGNLGFIIKNGKEVIIRFPVIPGINDNEKNIQQMKKFIAGYNGCLKEIHLLPFHNIADNKYNKLKLVNTMKDVHSLRETNLKPLKEEFESIGLKVKING